MSGKEGTSIEIFKQCPNCGKVYEPVLARKHLDRLIQEEFPDAPAWQREQHLSGICSDKCWNEFLGKKATMPIQCPLCGSALCKCIQNKTKIFVLNHRM